MSRYIFAAAALGLSAASTAHADCIYIVETNDKFLWSASSEEAVLNDLIPFEGDINKSDEWALQSIMNFNCLGEVDEQGELVIRAPKDRPNYAPANIDMLKDAHSLTRDYQLKMRFYKAPTYMIARIRENDVALEFDPAKFNHVAHPEYTEDQQTVRFMESTLRLLACAKQTLDEADFLPEYMNGGRGSYILSEGTGTVIFQNDEIEVPACFGPIS